MFKVVMLQAVFKPHDYVLSESINRHLIISLLKTIIIVHNSKLLLRVSESEQHYTFSVAF